MMPSASTSAALALYDSPAPSPIPPNFPIAATQNPNPASASATAARMPSASAARTPSASTSAALALYDSPVPPFIAPFSTRAMAKFAGYGALGPLAATCIGSASLVAGAVSTALGAGEKPGARPWSSAMLPFHQDAFSTEWDMLAGLCLQAGEVVDAQVLPGGLTALADNSNISKAVQQVVAGQMLLPPLAMVCLRSSSSSAALLTNIAISEQLLAEEMVSGAVASPPVTFRGRWGMGFAGAPLSGQHLLLGAPHLRRLSSCQFAARGIGAPRRGYAAATEEVISENIKRGEKMEELSRRLNIVEKAQEAMLRQRRIGRLVLISFVGLGVTFWNIYGDDLLKKGEKSITEFVSPRVKRAFLDEVMWSNFSAGINYMSYGVLGYSKEQQAIREKEIEHIEKADEERAREVEQKKAEWPRQRKEKEVLFNQNRPADEHPLARSIAWMQWCMSDEELAVKRAEWLKYQRLDAICARAIRSQEMKDEDWEKKREEEKKWREEVDAEIRKDQRLAEIRVRAIKSWEKKEEEKKRAEEKKIGKKM